jgi:hypothetical protein
MVAALSATPALAQTGSASRIAPSSSPSGQGTAPAAKIDLTIDNDAHVAGKREAPAALAAGGLNCKMTDAYYIGQNESKDDKGKTVNTKLYEVACEGGVGQVLQFTAPATVKHFDCFQIMSTPNLRCRLPANKDLKGVLGGFVTAAGRTCAISDFRYLGGTPAGDAYYEVACTGALGFVVKHNAANESTAFDCAMAAGTNLACKLTTAEQIKAADRIVIDKLVAASGKTCTIKDTRSVAKLANGGAAYEAACTDNTGYMLLSKADGSLDHAVPCAGAEALLGGCKLIDASTAQTQEVETYSKLAKASGFDCNVAKYRYLGTDAKKNEVVELACSNRPDGGIAILPADNSAGQVYDCVRAGFLGQGCKLTDQAVLYPKLTAALAAKGKGSCTVSNARWAGHYDKTQTDLIETACSDGLPGWVMEINAAYKANELLSCGEAAKINAACQLPGNVKK